MVAKHPHSARLDRLEKPPPYRRHKGTGQAYVNLNGRRIYLGKYSQSDTRQKYHRLVAEWEANGRKLSVQQDQLTIVELVNRFWQHARTYYPENEAQNVRRAMQPLKELYGEILAAQFGPRSLKAIRHKWVDAGWCRTNINRMVGRLKHVFKWAVGEELLPPGAYQALQAVPGLKYGRTKVRELEPVQPVPEAHINAIREHVSRPV